ncbi:hypothetical protein [Paraburkholderia sp.]|uniref:hypothetical protein n=1 Tax=Paraburkholderia sp. TaxID=1926495 RepID=UPI003C7ACC77
MPLLRKSLEHLAANSAWIDDEACVVDNEGRPDFSALRPDALAEFSQLNILELHTWNASAPVLPSLSRGILAA